MTPAEVKWLNRHIQKYQSKGLCYCCGQHRPIDFSRSQQRCTQCLNKTYAVSLNWLLNLPENRCRRCGQKPINPNRSKLFCTECIDFRVAREYKLREERKAANVCRNCGAKLAPWSTYHCAKCFSTNTKLHIKYKLKKKMMEAITHENKNHRNDK